MAIIYLTYRCAMAHDSDRQAGTQIEVTPEMIDAGVGVLVSCPGVLDIPVGFESLVVDIYCAMQRRSCPISEGRP